MMQRTMQLVLRFDHLIRAEFMSVLDCSLSCKDDLVFCLR